MARVRSDSNDASLHYQLAMAYWDRKEWDDAERSLRTAVLVAPSYADAHLALGVLPMRRGEGYWKKRMKKDGEEKVKAELLESSSHYRRAFLLNPLVDLRPLAEFDESEGGVSRVGREIVIYAIPWWSRELARGGNDFREGHYQKAFERLDALAHDQRFGGQDVEVAGPVLWFHGLAAAHIGHFDAAVRDFAILTGRSVRVEQDEAARLGAVPLVSNDFRYILATMLYLSGRYDEAVPTFRRVLELDLGVYVAHVQLARMAEEQGHMEEALQERRLAADVNQDDPDLLVELGVSLLKAGRTREAEAPLAEAARLNPRDARVPYLQGLTADALHDPGTAREAYTRFLAIAPSKFSTQRNEVQERLASPP
ncbi:MAG TPA: tetratricopeptide repeat protein [Gemmatimonadales bacterium]